MKIFNYRLGLEEIEFFMLHITEYFKKFTHLAPPEKVVKEAVEKTVEKHIGVKIAPDSIRVENAGQNGSGSTVYIAEHPTLKNEIFMHKRAILDDLRASLGAKAPRDIR